MLKFYIQTTEALKSLRDEGKGVVSFEYVVVAACVVATVVAVFTATGNTSISGALTGAIAAIVAKLPS